MMRARMLWTVVVAALLSAPGMVSGAVASGLSYWDAAERFGVAVDTVVEAAMRADGWIAVKAMSPDTMASTGAW